MDTVTVWHYGTVFLANFLFIFLKAFQQRNVAFDNYGWVFPTSFGLALTEVFVIASIAKLGFTLTLALTMGCASGSGAVIAMLMHKKYASAGKVIDTAHHADS